MFLCFLLLFLNQNMLKTINIKNIICELVNSGEKSSDSLKDLLIDKFKEDELIKQTLTEIIFLSDKIKNMNLDSLQQFIADNANYIDDYLENERRLAEWK